MKNPKLTSLPKESFPHILQNALLALSKAKSDTGRNGIKQNLISGFEATGVVPFEPNNVLHKIPGFAENLDEEVTNSSLISFLKEKRFGNANKNRQTRRKRTGLNIKPRKSIYRTQEVETQTLLE